MNYDEWRTETDRDYEDRMHVHDRGGSSLVSVQSGRCDCGVDTTRSVSARHGNAWQCKPCGELALRAQYDRRSRTA